MVSALDDGVGAIVAALDRGGLLDSTLVVFTADNGCAMYTEACSNGALLGGKLTFFEGGVRVPFMASWPGEIDPGQVVDAPVSTLDLLPTALALTGAAPPAGGKLDGESLLPLLRGETRALGRDRMAWRNGQSWAIRDGSWKLVQYHDQPPLLYDLAADVAESRNVAPSQRDRVAELGRRFRAWEAGTVAPLWSSRKAQYTSLADILARRPMHLLEAPEPDSIAIDF
jgi:arylsulfatase A-like enzyme